MLLRLPFILLLLLLAIFRQAAFAVSAAAEPVPLDPAVIHGRLDNGLRYYVQRNARPEKRVELRLAVDAGSALEDDDQRGIAHLIEHLCFRGTAHFPHSSLVAYLQSLGSDFGPHVNAQTSFDETIYRLAVPADAPGSLENGLKILSDWAGGVDFTAEEVQKERQIVVEEWRMRLGPGQRLLDQALPVLFKDSRYAARLPIGKKDIVETAPVEAIRRYYTDWYRPDNLTVIVVGDIDPRETEQQIRTLFAGLSSPPSPRPKPALTVPTPPAWTYSAATDPEFGSHIVRVAFPRETVPVATAADFDRRLAESLILRTLNARLAARREQPPTPFQLAQASDGVSLARARTELLLLALVGEGGVPAGFEALVTEGERLRRHGLTEGEFEREKSNLLKAAETRHAERDKRESDALADAWVWHALRGEPVASPDWAHAQTKAALGTLTLADANETVRRLLGSAGTLVRVETPAKAGSAAPDVAALQEIAGRIASTPLDPWRERSAPAALLAELPAPGVVTDRKTWPDIGVTEFTLGNGVRVVLKPSTFKQDEIVFSAYRPGGLSALPDELDLAGKFLGGYLPEAGFGPHPKSDLQKLLAGKQAGVGFMLEPSFDLVRGGCSAADAETALQLLHLGFSALRRDENAYRAVLGLNQTFETNVVMNPMLSFFNDMIDVRYDRHPRAARLLQSAEAWRALTLEKVLEAHRERFEDVGGFTFVFVGSFKPEEFEPLVTRYLGSLPAGNSVHRARDLGIRQIAGPAVRTFAKGSDPKAMLLLCDEQDVEGSARDGHVAWSLGNILQRTLIDRLRIDAGSVYALKVLSSIEKFPRRCFRLEVAVPCAPDGVEDALRVITAEVGRLRRDGPTPDEVRKEVEAQSRAIEEQAEKNSDWLWKLELIYKNEESFARLASPQDLVNRVTPDNLRAAAARYLRPDHWLRFTLMPAPAAQPSQP